MPLVMGPRESNAMPCCLGTDHPERTTDVSNSPDS